MGLSHFAKYPQKGDFPAFHRIKLKIGAFRWIPAWIPPNWIPNLKGRFRWTPDWQPVGSISNATLSRFKRAWGGQLARVSNPTKITKLKSEVCRSNRRFRCEPSREPIECEPTQPPPIRKPTAQNHRARPANRKQEQPKQGGIFHFVGIFVGIDFFIH